MGAINLAPFLLIKKRKQNEKQSITIGHLHR
jgi:hypothetical protein